MLKKYRKELRNGKFCKAGKGSGAACMEYRELILRRKAEERTKVSSVACRPNTSHSFSGA